MGRLRFLLNFFARLRLFETLFVVLLSSCTLQTSFGKKEPKLTNKFTNGSVSSTSSSSNNNKQSSSSQSTPTSSSSSSSSTPSSSSSSSSFSSSSSSSSSSTPSSSSSSLSSSSSSSSTPSTQTLTDRVRFGKINGIDLVDELSTKQIISTDYNFSNCTAITLPTNFESYVLPSGCVYSTNEITIKASARLLIHSGTKLKNTTLKVKGKLQILGTMSRYVELENVQILPDGNLQQVYMRYTNMVGGKLYPNTGTNYSQANFKIKLSTFDGLTAPILIYQPQEQILLWNNYFKNSYGVQIYNTSDPDDNVTKYTTTNNVSIWNNVFEPTSSGFVGGYAINYQRGPDRDTGYYLGVNSISHNAFLLPNPTSLTNQTAIKLESSINGQTVINDLDVYDNYFGDLDENISVLNAGKFVLNRIAGEGNNPTYLDCNSNTSTHCVNGPGYVYKTREHMNMYNNYYVEPLTNKTLGSISLSGYQTLTLEKGNYNGLVDGQPTVINIPDGNTLQIPAGTKMSNYEFRISGGSLETKGESRNFVVLNNVRIRITGSGETGWSSLRMENTQMKGGSLHSYEANVNPKRSMIVAQGCTFEGLDLPIFIHNSYSWAWFHSNVFLKSRGIVLGYDHSWENGYIKIMNNTFIEGQGAFNTYLIDLAANDGMQGLASDKIIFKYNNFFSSSNVKSIYFGDNFPSGTEKLDLGNSNFFWNETTGQALRLSNELNSKIRTPATLTNSLPWQIESASPHDIDQALYYFDFRWSEPDYKTY